MKQQILIGLALFLAPIIVDLAVDLWKGSQRYRLNDLITNVTLALLTAAAGAGISVATLAIYVHVQQSYSLFEVPMTAVSSWLIGFLVYDVLYYWAHRSHHRMAWLWAVHEVHHSGEDMNFGLAVRQSAFGNATTWFFFLPMAVLGLPLEIFLGVTTIQIVFQYSLHNTFVKPLGWLEWVLVTPSQHRVHHARNHLYIDKNYGNVLVIWDRLFGTYQAELPAHPPVYGLRRSVRTWNPLTITLGAAIDLVRKAAVCTRWSDKVLCFIKEPAWQPASAASGAAGLSADDGPSAQFRKYDPPMAQHAYAYCLLQLGIVIGLIIFVLLRFEQLSAAAIALTVALILSSTWVLGSQLDGKRAHWRWEALRFGAAGVFGLLVVLL
jgi:sterol desaturase/sphingolipid hydroxylase (fatty acid hydroxylase superfamily)